MCGPSCLFALCHGTEGVNVSDGGCSISLSLAGEVMGAKPQLTCCGLGVWERTKLLLWFKIKEREEDKPGTAVAVTSAQVGCQERTLTLGALAAILFLSIFLKRGSQDASETALDLL